MPGPYRNHSLRFILARRTGTIAGLAVQDGNLAERNPVTGARVSVEDLVRYAIDTLRLDYIFWGTEEPYYSAEVLPWLASLSRSTEELKRYGDPIRRLFYNNQDELIDVGPLIDLVAIVVRDEAIDPHWLLTHRAARGSRDRSHLPSAHSRPRP